MIKTEFGIIDNIDTSKDYYEYEPQKYNCIYIDDEVYINDWWNRLETMKTYFHCINRAEFCACPVGCYLNTSGIAAHISGYCTIRSENPYGPEPCGLDKYDSESNF